MDVRVTGWPRTTRPETPRVLGLSPLVWGIPGGSGVSCVKLLLGSGGEGVSYTYKGDGVYGRVDLPSPPFGDFYPLNGYVLIKCDFSPTQWKLIVQTSEGDGNRTHTVPGPLIYRQSLSLPVTYQTGKCHISGPWPTTASPVDHTTQDRGKE